MSIEKQKHDERQAEILELVRGFCTKHLDESYLKLAENLTKKLGRKRDKPLMKGKAEVWAAAIIHALGTINFLFDPAFEPYVSVDDINAYFDTKKSTTTNKSKQIRDMFKMERWDNEFSTDRMNEHNPFNNLVLVDGMIVPLESLPEEFQEMVKQARAEGKDISFMTK